VEQKRLIGLFDEDCTIIARGLRRYAEELRLSVRRRPNAGEHMTEWRKQVRAERTRALYLAEQMEGPRGIERKFR
jgi:hypothetical protein